MKNSRLAGQVRCVVLVLPLFSVAASISGCGSTSTPPPQITVNVSPKRAAVTTGQTQTFAASVTGSSNTSVSWEVDGVPGGSASVGTISTAGVYAPPATGSSHTVLARSAADSTATATSTIALFAGWMSPIRHSHRI